MKEMRQILHMRCNSGGVMRFSAICVFYICVGIRMRSIIILENTGGLLKLLLDSTGL